MVRQILLIAALCAFEIFIIYPKSINAQPENEQDGPFKTVNLINLSTDGQEKDFLDLVKDLNSYLDELGIQYGKTQAYKLRNDSNSKYQYVFESNWPSRAAYEKAHDTDAFKNVLKKWQARMKVVFEDNVYGRYVPMK